LKEAIKHRSTIARAAMQATSAKNVFQYKNVFLNYIGSKFDNLLSEFENDRLLRDIVG
jgi:hypothetical protein